MFTGIIEATGLVAAFDRQPAGGVRLAVTTTLPVHELPLGASIAVDGVCLTVIERGPGRFAADLGPETLACTTLDALFIGARVHLERPLRLGDALGGHLVAGHVDGVGTIVARRPLGDALQLQLTAPAAVAPTLVPKGSITVDGVSLTVNKVDSDQFSVTLIPHTLAVTTLGGKMEGARVNLEGDLIGKHVDRLVRARLKATAAASDETKDDPAREGLSLETLRKHGFV
ncbi:MAG TPA: riboflavin synthase [Polyangia bacterium]|jgi:riboflavin synthase|nr:riboflavin synthase [Polyangia bacterium]